MNLYIELCNFTDYPLGGHLSFAKHLTCAMQGELYLIGITTNACEPIHKWFIKKIGNYDYYCFNVYYTKKKNNKPIIPTRLKDYVKLSRCINQIDFDKYNNIIVQTPEVLLALPKEVLNKVILIMPGVENPLSFSRYKFAHFFSKLYDNLFFERANKTHFILAAADKESINNCIERSHKKITKDKIVQFPTRYDSNIFHINYNEDLRTKYNIPENNKIIITTGRLNWYKGWKFLIDSFSIFLNTYNNSTLYFIGEGEDKEKILEYINELDLNNKIKLIGYQSLNTISDYLNMADLFIMGSYKEGWSTSLVEAVSCGTPCVVTNFSSASEMVKDGINGYVIQNRDENNFAKKMSEAINIPKKQLIEYADSIQYLSVSNMKREFSKFLY